MKEQTAEWINRLGRFCGKRDVPELTPDQLYRKYQIRQADVLVLFGGSILCGGDVLADAMKQNVAQKYVIVGGAGHTTETLRRKMHAEFPEIMTEGLPEAEIFEAYLEYRYGLHADLLECRSTNCGNNITYFLELLAENGISFHSIILIQDATMQRRMDAGLRKQNADALIINFAAYQAEVTVRNGEPEYHVCVIGMEEKMNRDYTQINAETIDGWVKNGWEWGKPIDHDTWVKAAQGDWKVYLTPTKSVPGDWFCEMKGARVLGLASGGGQQMPIFTAAGAKCTVLDYSEEQLRMEKLVADREGYTIDLIRADMTKPLPFEAESFDLIFHPVSNCYVEDVLPIWRECFRVLKKGGILLAGLDNGFNYLFGEEEETTIRYRLPYNPLKDEALYEESVKNNWGIQFSHTIEEQIGGQLAAGFVLKDVYQDTNGYGKLEEYGVPTFWATKAVKPV